MWSKLGTFELFDLLRKVECKLLKEKPIYLTTHVIKKGCIYIDANVNAEDILEPVLKNPKPIFDIKLKSGNILKYKGEEDSEKIIPEIWVKINKLDKTYFMAFEEDEKYKTSYHVFEVKNNTTK